MKTDRKIKAEKRPPKLKADKGTSRAAPKTNGKHPLVAYEHIPVGVVEASLDGRYMNVNEEFCRILGYSRGELLRRGIKDCTHEDDYSIDNRLYEQLITQRIPFYKLEKRFICKDGGIIWVELTRSLVCDEKGNPLYTVGVVLDISDRKDVEKVLRESVERLRLATGAAQMFMWEWDFQTQSYTLADNFADVLGFSAGLLPRNNFDTLWALSPREDLQRISEAFEDAVENQSDLHALPYRVINPENGQIVWLEISANIVYDRQGNPERMFGVAQNITENKKAQDEIAIISRMPEENPNPVMRLTPDGKVLYANSPGSSLLEFWKQQTDLLLPGELQKQLAEVFVSGSKREIEIEQNEKTFSCTLVPIREAGCVNFYGKDITDRKLAENRLSLLAEISELIRETEDPRELLYVVSKAIGEHLAVKRSLFNETDLAYDLEIVHRDYYNGVPSMAGVRKVSDYSSITSADMQAGKTVINTDSKIDPRTAQDYERTYAPNSERAYVAVPLMRDHRWVGSLWVSDDAPRQWSEEDVSLLETIAERTWTAVEKLRFAEELRDKEAELEEIINQTPFMLTRCTRDLRYQFVSRAYAKMIGRTPQEVEGKPIVEIMGAEGLKTISPYIEKVLAGSRVEYEVGVPFLDAGTPFLHVVDEPDRDEHGNVVGWFASIVDISERKRAENLLRSRARQQQAVAQLGELALRERDLQKVFDQATTAIAETLEIEYCKVLELLEGEKSLLLRSGVGWQKGLVGSATVGTGLDSQAGFTLQSAEPVVVEDLRQEQRFIGPPLLVNHDVISGMSCIIRGAGGLPWGVLGAHSTRHLSFTAEDVNFLVAVANILGDAIQREQSEEALRASEERYRFIVENTSDGIWWVELTEPMPVSLPEDEQLAWYYRHAVMRQCNLGLARMYGYDSIEEVVGLPMRILMPRENPVNLELSRQFIRSGYRLVDAESREINRDGRELVFLNNMVGIVEDGKLVGEWGTNRDITERKRAEEALRRNEKMFSTLVDAAPFGVYFIDSEFRLRAINKGSEAVFSGIHPLIGRDFAEVLRIVWPEPFATEAIERFRHTLRTGESFVAPPVIEQRANIEEIEAYDWQIHRITLSDGTFGVVCYFYDLSEQKRMEASVRASEALYRSIARNIPGGGVYVVDKDFRYLVAEGPVTEAFGLSREILEGHSVSEVFPDERGQRMEDRLRRNFAGESVSFETQFNGRVYWTQQTPLHDSIGQAIILTLDITERKQAEEALRQSEERFARFMHHLPGLAWIKDLQGRYVYANAAAEQAFNTPREKLYGRTDEDIFDPDIAVRFRRNDEQALTDEKGVQVIETLEHADGVLHYSLVNKFPIPGPDGNTTLIGGTAFDITERLRAEEALRESEERFRAILRQATAGIVRKDAEGRLIFVNEAFCNMLGRTEAELLGKTMWEFMHEDDVAENKRSYKRLMLDGIPFKLERRFLREDGSVIWADASVSPIMDATGKPQSAVAVEVDITGRKQAEEALLQLNLQLEDRVLSRTAKLRAVNQTLREEIAERKRVGDALRKSEAAARENEEKLSTLFELLPVGISFLDTEGQIIQMNPALANILKLSKEQLSDQAYRSRKYIRANGSLMSPGEFASRRALTEGKTIYNVDTGVVLENSEVIWTSVSAAPVNVADVGAVVVTVDITESKHAERALQESRERLQILSQRLVEVQEEERRAIARELHDRVGQTLAALNINLIIINGQLGDKVDQQISTRLSDSMKLVAETISLVRDVMSNLRPSVLDDYGLEAAIDSHLSQYMSRYEIKVKFEKPDQPIPRLVPSMEMTFLRIAQEALMNIARHAQATQVNLLLKQEENAIHMIIQDNGIGINSWQQANRPGSHGLTIMRERAEAFGGSLRISSIPGQGTRVEVSIPIETSNPSQDQKGMSP